VIAHHAGGGSGQVAAGGLVEPGGWGGRADHGGATAGGASQSVGPTAPSRWRPAASSCHLLM